jgi:signal transduction histidine kinase
VQVEAVEQGLEFVVSDSGRGIPAELLPKVFELFFQEDDSHREYASAGLGLNIVKRLVGAMSGEIAVTSEVGRGSTFRVRFPYSIPADSLPPLKLLDPAHTGSL